MTSPIHHAAIAVIGGITAVAAMPTAGADRITLNDTGLIQCLDKRQHWSSQCIKSNQDAAYGRDVNDSDARDGAVGFSYRKVCRSGQLAGNGTCPADPALGNGPNDWGCTYDNISRLTWEVKTNDGGVHDGQRAYTNNGRRADNPDTDALWLIGATNAEGLCGATNWRLPDALELHSILNYGMAVPGSSGPLVEPAFFPNTWDWKTWTRNESPYNAHFAWSVNFGDGSVDLTARRVLAATARLVHDLDTSMSFARGARASDRFIPSDDGSEVTDSLTGLVWRRCAEGRTWNIEKQTCDGSQCGFLWEDAIAYAKANRVGGWRVPNARELFSIVDQTQHPAIDQYAFPNFHFSHTSFISSTLSDKRDAEQPEYKGPYMQGVSFWLGLAYPVEALSGVAFHLRLVRRGRE